MTPISTLRWITRATLCASRCLFSPAQPKTNVISTEATLFRPTPAPSFRPKRTGVPGERFCSLGQSSRSHREQRSGETRFSTHSPSQPRSPCRCLFSLTQPKTNVISTGATDGCIVRCEVERSLYFVVVLPLLLSSHLTTEPIPVFTSNIQSLGAGSVSRPSPITKGIHK